MLFQDAFNSLSLQRFLGASCAAGPQPRRRSRGRRRGHRAQRWSAGRRWASQRLYDSYAKALTYVIDITNIAIINSIIYSYIHSFDVRFISCYVLKS